MAADLTPASAAAFWVGNFKTREPTHFQGQQCMVSAVHSHHHMPKAITKKNWAYCAQQLGSVRLPDFKSIAVTACCLDSLYLLSHFLLVVLQLALNLANLLDLFLCSAILNARTLIYYLTHRTCTGARPCKCVRDTSYWPVRIRLNKTLSTCLARHCVSIVDLAYA